MTITLAAASTIQGVAGSATAITATIFGDEVTTTDAFKKLYQGQLPSSAGVLYTVPGSTQVIIKAISLVNTTAGALTVVLFVDGSAASNRIVNLTVPANGFATYDADGWKVFDATGQQLFVGATGAAGSPGTPGTPGAAGTNGWSPTLAVVSNGSGGFVFQIVGWVGGTGTPPSSTNQFIGSAGIVGTAAAAQDIRGPAGAPGASVLAFGIITGNTGTATADASPDTIAITGANGISTAATETPDGLVVTGPNLFGVVTGNTGTATADVTGDTLAITGANGISTAATDTPDGLVITGPNVFVTATGNTGTATADVFNDNLAIVGTGSVSTVATDAPEVITITNAPATAAAAGNLSVAGFKKLAGSYDAAADFGFVGDLRQVDDGATTGGTGIITSATAAFVAGDVGKRITLTKAGASASAIYAGTISSLNSATSVNVSPNTGTTVAATGHLRVGTDNTAAIALMVSTINSSTLPGGIVIFGNSATSSWGFPTRPDFTKPCIIQGIGRGYNHDQGNYVTDNGGTRLAWWGTTSDGGTAFGAFWTFRPTTTQNLHGAGFRDCWIDGRNGDQAQALFGVKMASVNGFTWNSFFVMDCLASAIWCDIDATPTEQESTARGMISNIGIRQLDLTTPAPMTTPILMTSAVTLSTTPQSLTVAANTLPASGYLWTATTVGRPVLVNYTGGGGTTTLTGCTCSAEDTTLSPTTVNGGNVVQATPGNGAAAILSGNATANTNLSIFNMWQINHAANFWGPAAIECFNSDSMVFDQVVVNGGNATNDGAINRIRKPGVRFNGHQTTLSLATRNHVFREGDAGAGGVSNMALLNTGAKLAAPAGPNYWWGYQLGNGAPAPNIEAGGFLDWSGNGAFTLPGLRNIDTGAGTTYVVGVAKQVPNSVILMPPQGIQVGTVFHWRHNASKTAAGTAARLHHIRIGTTGTVTDAIVMTFTITPTAILDGGWVDIYYKITVANSASSTGEGTIQIDHNPSTTGPQGLSNQNAGALGGTPTVFTSPISGFWYISLSITTGTSEALSTAFCTADVLRIGNQAA